MNELGGEPTRHRLVIVGGGFGGLPATRLLARKPVDVTLVDRRNHHLFEPLLYQVATGMLSPGQIAPPIWHVVRRYQNVRVELAEVTGFDLDRRIVYASTVAHLHTIELPYDSLIVAAGVTQSYFGHDELAHFAPAWPSTPHGPPRCPSALRTSGRPGRHPRARRARPASRAGNACPHGPAGVAVRTSAAKEGVVSADIDAHSRSPGASRRWASRARSSATERP
jgi:Pyridine nucleotide-disulphide oxidoreductase